MKFLASIALFVLFVQTASAQENFIPGSILTTSGDTVHGRIDYRDWEMLPSSITFKYPSGELKTFKAGEIASFTTGRNDIFLSLRLAMDVSNYKLTDLIENDAEMIVRDTAVFVRLVVKGKLSLYYLKDGKEKEHYWFRKGNDSIYEMRITRKMVKSQSLTNRAGRDLATLKLYQVILPGLVADCEGMAEKVKNTGYSMKEFTDVAVQFNNCTDGGKDMEVSRVKKVRLTFGPIAGVSVVSLKFTGYEDNPINRASFPASWTYMAGLALKIVLPFNYDSWIIYNDLVYRPYKTSAAYDESNIMIPGSSTHYTFEFSMGYLKLNTMLRYQFPKWQVKPFINIGMSNSFALVNSNSYSKTISTKPQPTYTEGPAIEDPKTYEAGFIGGVGACFKGFGLEVRYEWANGMSPYSTLTAHETSFSFLLSYTFGQK